MSYQTSANDNAEAWCYFSKDFDITCEPNRVVAVQPKGADTDSMKVNVWLYRFTGPDGQTYDVLGDNCKDALTRLKDKYYGLPYNKIPEFGTAD